MGLCKGFIITSVDATADWLAKAWVSPVARVTVAVAEPLAEATVRVSPTVEVLSSHAGTAGGCPDNVPQVGSVASA